MTYPRYIRLFIVSLCLSWCGVSTLWGQGFDFGSYQIISSTRVGRTDFEYVMRVSITNKVASAQGVSAQVFSLSTNTVIVDGSANFGDLSFGASAVSSDTFTIRQNRLFAFNPADLQWFVSVQSMRLSITVNTPVSGLLTNGASVLVTGSIGPNVDGVRVNNTVATLTGTNFTAVYPLEEGRNTLTVLATNIYGGAGLTNVLVNRDTTPPILSIETPTQGDVLGSRQVTVTGQINDIVPGTVNPEQATVMINGLAATILNRSYALSGVLLAPGLNTITAVGRDRAGNESQRQITITFRDPASQKQLVPLAGGGQTGGISTVLPSPLVVELVDGDGVVQTNQPVTFTVSRNDGVLMAAPNSGRSLTVSTDDKGQAGVLFQLGTRSGVGNNEVTVTSAGVAVPILFGASATGAPPVHVAALIPETQSGEAGRTLPVRWTAFVTDAGGNPVNGAPVTFSVTQGGGNFGGTTTVVTNSDSDGRAFVFHTLGTVAGVNNNVVVATIAGITNSVAIFTASAQTAGSVSDTRVTGLVLDNANRPMSNILCRIENTLLSTVTDAQGQFILSPVPVGSVRLNVDARNRGYPGEWHSLQFDLVTVAGQDNHLDRPVYMLPVDLASAALVGGDQDVTLHLTGVPGSSLTIFAHSLRDANGQPITNQVTWTQVNNERIPMAPPQGSQPILTSAILPAGYRFNPPAKLCIPNSGLSPGQILELYGFDHDIGAFVSVGTATVAPDGAQICSNPGFGVVKSGWHPVVPPPPPPTCLGNCDDNNPCTSDSCVNGVCVHTPVGNGSRCDDSSGCSMKVCQNGSCVTQTQQANGQACDDGKFCTDNDKCQNGDCKGTPLEYPPIEVTQSYNITELISLVKTGLKPVETVTGCQLGDLSVSGSIGFSVERKCCEAQRIRNASGTKLKGSVSVAVPELECAVPGLGASFLDGAVQIGVFVFVGGGGSISASGGLEACTQKNEFCVEGSVSMSLGGRAKALVGSDKILQLKVEGSTGGAVSVSCCNGMGEFKVVWNPLTISGTATLAGFIDKSVSWALPAIPAIGPIPFSCPSPN